MNKDYFLSLFNACIIITRMNTNVYIKQVCSFVEMT